MSAISSACSPVSGWRDQQVVDVHADRLGVDRVHGVLGVDVGADAAVALRLGDDVHRRASTCPTTPGRRSRRSGPGAGRRCRAPGRGTARRSGWPRCPSCTVLAHPHDRALAELLLDLAERHVQRLVAFRFGHLPLSSSSGSAIVRSAIVRRPVRSCGRSLAVTLRRGCDGPAGAAVRSITNVCSYDADAPAGWVERPENGPHLPDPSRKCVAAVTERRAGDVRS